MMTLATLLCNCAILCIVFRCRLLPRTTKLLKIGVAAAKAWRNYNARKTQCGGALTRFLGTNNGWICVKFLWPLVVVSLLLVFVAVTYEWFHCVGEMSECYSSAWQALHSKSIFAYCDMYLHIAEWHLSLTECWVLRRDRRHIQQHYQASVQPSVTAN